MQHSPWMELLAAWPWLGPLACQLLTIARGIPAFFQPKPAGLPGAPGAARTGCGRLLRHLAARADPCRARRLRPDQPGRDPADGRRRQRPHRARCATSTAATWISISAT